MKSHAIARRWVPSFFSSLLIVAAPVHANKAENDAAMLKLATARGCMACHSILPTPKRPDGLPPIAPAWRDIALKYRDDPRAADRLTRTVMTGSNPRSRHWVGKVSDVTMPPNASVVTEAEARVLVNWLLVLVP
jgi:cytochrome c